MSLETIPAAWAALLPELTAQYAGIREQLRAEADIRPRQGLWFEALRAVDPQEARVVILGQDPYHGEDKGIQQAHGLAFSVPAGVRPPPSLRNILKELASDIGEAHIEGGNLSNWSQQGVLLLNASLTTRGGEAGAHAAYWHAFTERLMAWLGKREQPLVFILWGSHAQRHQALIAAHHCIITSAHPSPLSAHRGFFGSRPFSRTNAVLTEWGQVPILW
ncbi:MAG TPA: uracil-DNA glycosylase [Methylovorus sp.]|nr:uracil-DNA glycosylase [Methylovorus sp.]